MTRIVTNIAPHLTGRMLPGLFSYMPFTKKPRFPGDPWATARFTPTWYWMHTTECGSPNHVGSYKTVPVGRLAYPADVDWVLMAAPAATPEQPRAIALQAALFPEVA